MGKNSLSELIIYRRQRRNRGSHNADEAFLTLFYLNSGAGVGLLNSFQFGQGILRTGAPILPLPWRSKTVSCMKGLPMCWNMFHSFELGSKGPFGNLEQR